MSRESLCNTCNELKTEFFSQVELVRGIFKRICQDCWKAKTEPRKDFFDDQEDD